MQHATSFDRSSFVRALKGLALLVLSVAAVPVTAANCVVDGSSVQQSIRGFGASSAWASTYTTAQMDQLFGTGNGQIGLTLLRHRIPPDSGFATGTSILQGARDRGATIWATCWSPPAQWKNNNNANSTGSNNCPATPGAYLLPANYQNYANYLASYVTTLKNSYNVDIFAISPQNEPNWCPNYEGSWFDGNDFLNFVKNYMGPTFQSQGLSTRIIIPEPINTGSLGALANPCLNDAACRGYLFAVATHLYGTPASAFAAAAANNKEYWETEISSFEAYDASMTHGLVTAAWIHGSMASSMNAFHYWWAVSNNNNEGLLSQSMGTPKRFYVMGNYSKFVRPGYNRIGATVNPTGNIFATAYKNPANTNYVIVAYNNSGGAINQTFQLNNIAVGSVTPYITDGSRDLAAQGAVTVTGGQFTYSMPAMSVVSFVGSAAAGTPTRTPTYAGTSTRTPTPSPTPFTQLYDDFEDGNTNNNWGGTWTTYQGASSTVTVTVAGPGAPGSTVARGQVTGTINDYGGLTGTFNGTPRDLRGYVAVQFQVRGTGTYWFQIPQTSITDGDHFGQTFTATGTWTTVTLYFSNFAQRGFGAASTLDLSSIQMFQWGSNATGAMNFEIDDVRFLTYVAPASPTRTPTPAPPSATRTSTLTATRTVTLTSTGTGSATRTTTLTPVPPTLTRTGTGTATRTSTLTPVPPTATGTGTSTATRTGTPSNTGTRTATATVTLTASPSVTLTATRTQTPLPTLTVTGTNSPVPPASTFTSTPTLSPLPTLTWTRTSTITVSVTSTLTPVPPTGTPSVTLTGTRTATQTVTLTGSRTATLTHTRTQTPPPTATMTATVTQTDTPVPPASTLTSTPTLSPLPTLTATRTATVTVSSTPSVTLSVSPSVTLTQSVSPLPTLTATESNTPVPPASTLTSTPTVTLTNSPTSTVTLSASPSVTLSVTQTQSPLPTLTVTQTDTPVPPASTQTATRTVTGTSTPSFTVTLSSTRTSSPSVTPTATGTPTVTLTVTPILPVVTSLSATGNALAGGFTVSVTGSNFQAGAQVLVDGTPVLANVVSSTLITFTAPAHAAGNAVVRVENPVGLISIGFLNLPYVAPATATASPTSTTTPTATPTITAPSTGTQTRTATYTVTQTAIPTQGSGLVEVLKVVPLPNPNPRELRLLLEGTADRVRVRVWSRAFSLMAEESFAGPLGPGWCAVALPSGFMNNARSGSYFATVTAYKGAQASPRVQPVKFTVLK